MLLLDLHTRPDRPDRLGQIAKYIITGVKQTCTEFAQNGKQSVRAVSISSCCSVLDLDLHPDRPRRPDLPVP